MKSTTSKNNQTKNVGASVRARLLNIAKKGQRDYNALLLQYAQERFLYKLSISPFKKKSRPQGGTALASLSTPDVSNHKRH
jgi:hypothetical protein